jgi:endonuclease/exonuclease/phosphatase family metal-dependent hydrolase
MKLRFLTYNLAMLPWPLGKLKEERAEKFADEILGKNPGYDFICLQEIFDESIRRYLAERLKNEYPYMIEKSASPFLLNQDSGMFFASRFPVLHHSFVEFEDKSLKSSDALADKGILDISFQLDPGNDKKILYVFVTHLQSTELLPPASFASVRIKQLSQIRGYIENALESGRKTYPPSGMSAILLGDFNVISGTGEYNDMLKILGNPDDLFLVKNTGQDGFTWNSKENLYIRFTNENDNDLERLDYIFTFNRIPYADQNRRKNGVEIGKIKCESCNLFTPRANGALKELPDNCDLSDHYGLEAFVQID